MARKEFENIVAQAPIKSMWYKVDTTASLIASGKTNVLSYYAPVGTIIEVKAIDFLAGNYVSGMGATSGTHSLSVGYQNGINLLYGTASYNASLHLSGTCFTLADQKQTPNDLSAQTLALGMLTFDETYPLVLTYYNNTNVEFNQPFNFTIWGIQTVIKEES